MAHPSTVLVDICARIGRQMFDKLGVPNFVDNRNNNNSRGFPQVIKTRAGRAGSGRSLLQIDPCHLDSPFSRIQGMRPEQHPQCTFSPCGKFNESKVWWESIDALLNWIKFMHYQPQGVRPSLVFCIGARVNPQISQTLRCGLERCHGQGFSFETYPQARGGGKGMFGWLSRLVREDMDHHGTDGRQGPMLGGGGKRVHQTPSPRMGRAFQSVPVLKHFSRTGSADGGLCLGGVWGPDSLLPKDPKTRAVDQIPVLIADWVELGSTSIPGFLEDDANFTACVSLLVCASFFNTAVVTSGPLGARMSSSRAAAGSVNLNVANQG
ncbi:hypothetical protein GX51_01176 [Blastomyces parvus]|uniref:Uncharacterized protein n=1 Tax=Blastomyces parvus TaxID=2060905 RepID=A0A2B7XHG0_9EURO|nr:hypothetical protein GX51_01176 [Blastomyces parvus]